MCKEYPGPRCSNHIRKQKDRIEDQLRLASKKEEPDSLALKGLKTSLRETTEIYYSTPEGLKEIAANAPTKLPYYQKTRDLQSEAYKEEHSGRVNTLAQYLTSTQSFFSEEEVLSIIQNTRRLEESALLNQVRNGELIPLGSQDTSREYQSMLQHYAQHTKGNKSLLQELANSPAPEEITSVQTYQKAYANLNAARNQLKKEIHRLSIFQDTSQNVAEAYYDAYRAQYQELYGSADKTEQPNPPKEWVTGSYSHTGFQHSTTSNLMPNDPASMYACYRLRIDNEAIPDYLKNSRNLSALSIDEESQTIVIASSNNRGKSLPTMTFAYSDKNSSRLSEALSGKIMFTTMNEENFVFLEQMRKQGVSFSIITSSDIVAKQLNLPDYSPKTFCQSAGLELGNDKGSQSETLLKAYFKNRQQIFRQWQAKTARRDAPPIPTLPLDSRFVLKKVHKDL